MNDSKSSSKTAFQAELLKNRLVKRHKHLQNWVNRCGVGVYRLYDRDIPEIPLVLDFYTEVFSGSNAVSGALFKRPYYKDYAEEALWIDAMKVSIAGALQIDLANIFVKIRQRLRTTDSNDSSAEHGRTQYTKTQSSTTQTMDIKEGAFTFRVNLSDYIDTGLFPDLRKARSYIQEVSHNKMVLNLFCYTGTFSVYAAAGGAARIDSLDMSKTYLEWAKTNFILNGFSKPHLHNSNCHFIRADAIRFLDDAINKNYLWDIIILDPPSFSNSKKMLYNSLNGSLDIQRDYITLLNKSLKVLRTKGQLLFCVNSHSFKFSNDDFNQYCKTEFPNIIIKDRTEMFRDEDFKEKRMPLCKVITL
ncbi:MAG: class I SAM-dependent methyltransferase [Termitinemataceae bacterium]|nr:MAG: class I SAM-dependent methyltransferase [Termitinemataceae bacterium]